ncbi:MAG: 3-isopropylmalate dehydratase small subunit [Spirochaetales bacterium]|nr:3-isopropylmalate dehydratase small subunit [Spirochaetales bacterium]
MKSFEGSILFLDRSDINTDEIIPAEYLTEISKAALSPYLLENLKLEGFNPVRDIRGKQVIVTRSNFGCGSSREHAAWALEANGINLVVAESFARIFRQNMFNCGMMAVELDPGHIDRLFATYAGTGASLRTDFERMRFIVSGNGGTEEIAFSISGFDKALVTSGGWVDYADAHY